jgi:hypothetical protein
MKFFENYKKRKELERDREKFFRSLVIKNLSDFNAYCDFLNSKKITNILKKFLAVEIEILFVLLVIANYIFG